MAQRGIQVWHDPEHLQTLVDEYFDSRWATRKFHGKDANNNPINWEETYQLPPTLAGLAEHLGVVRRTLFNYRERDGFAPVIARAKNRIAIFAEEALYTREGSNGAKFALEVNHKYGREDEGEGGTGDGFNLNIIPPAAEETARAIPKWSEDDE